MNYFLLFSLFIPSLTDYQLSTFNKTNDGMLMSSSLNDKNQWVSYSQEYCFLSQELQFDLTYEFSPITIPAFTLKNSTMNLFITLDIDPAVPLRFQAITNEWKKVALDYKNERICFLGAYLPSHSSDDAAFIFVSKIKTAKTQISTDQFVFSEYW